MEKRISKKRGTANSIQEYFLNNLNIKSLDEVNDWFKMHYAHQFTIDRMQEAVNLALTFKDKKVTIVGDYDADGITSTSILCWALKWAGFTDYSYRIPRRFSEGFGINDTIIDEIDKGLIITCDNGIAQIETIKKAKEKGLTVIVLDHHLPDANEASPADVIIDPEAIENSAIFNGYCGAGLCYKFAEILLNYDKPKLAKLMTLAALGTVADVMKIREENYVIVRNGMKYMQSYETCVPGLYALLSKTNLLGHLTTKDIGFTLGPCCNAASRMDDNGATKVIEIMTYDGPYENVLSEIDKLIEINDLRKNAKKETLKKAYEIIAEKQLDKCIPITLIIPDVHEGIIGIIASQLSDEYNVPVVVLTNVENGMLKGSCRSCGDFDIKAALDKASDCLEAYGGHTGAAGLTLKAENFDKLCKILGKCAKGFTFDIDDNIYYDLEIKASEIASTIAEIAKYEPFGEGNPMPVFKVTDFVTKYNYGGWKKLMGSEGKTVKLYGQYADALNFNRGDEFKYIDNSLNVVLYGTLSDNYFKNNIIHQVEFTEYEII